MLTITLTVMNALATGRAWFQGRTDSERGASAVEYALLVGLIAAVIAAAVLVLGGDVKGIFQHTSSSICTTGGTTCTTTS